MQICVPPNIDLICGLVLIFFCGLVSVSDDTDYSYLLQTKSVHLSLSSNVFTLNTAVVGSICWLKLQVAQNLIIAGSCIAIHSRA